MAVNVKMGVDIGGFTSGIKQGQQILKGLNAELKASESEFKATGNAEQKLASQTKTLTSQLNVQKGIADQARAALKAMTDAGVDPTDAAYQRLYVTLMNAESGANDALAALNALKGGTEGAADGAEKLTTGLNDIGKKISLDQVIGVVGSISSGLENAAKKAVSLGEEIMNAVLDSAKWADDMATQAEIYGVSVERMQQMMGLVSDTSADAILRSQKKLRNGIGEQNKATMEALKDLGLAFTSGKGGSFQLVTEDSLDLMFRAGQALKNLSENEREAKAQDLFGRSWDELKPLFNQFQTVEEYETALKGVSTVDEDLIKNGAELNDKVEELRQKLETLSNNIMLELAPALTEGATALSGLLDNILEYLKTDDGKKMLQDLGTAVSGLFKDLGSIDPDKVVEGFTGVITSVTTGVQWLVDNVETVKGILGVIVGAWVASNATIAGLEIMKLIQGIQGLTGAGAAAAAGEAGKAVGTSWGTGFAGAVLKAAPWLLFLYETLKPSEGSDKIGNNTLVDENGNLTREALEYGYQLDENGEVYQDRREILEKAAQEAWDLMRTGQLDKEALIRLQNTVLNNDAFTAMAERFMEMRTQNPTDWMNIEDIDMADWVEKYGVPEIPAEIAAPDDTAEMLEEEIGTVDVTAVVHFVDEEGNSVTPGSFDAPPTHKTLRKRKKANGIWSVPYDGYLAQLHRGERVVPAREVQSRSYNSNLYVESMYMNSGMDAAGLASAMAAAQRRQMSGYGS